MSTNYNIKRSINTKYKRLKNAHNVNKINIITKIIITKYFII